MDEAVVERLLALNRRFYEQFAAPFSQSRRQPPPGFGRLLPYLPGQGGAVRLLDVGAGDGRFGRFLQAQGRLAAYTAVDFSAGLLQLAQSDLPGRFYERDLARPDALAGLAQFDVVAALALLQHIPGQANRARLLAEIGGHLAPDGRLFLSTWQFAGSPRQRRKLLPWTEVGLADADVEPGDYLLSWQRGGFGRRYVAHIDEAGTAALAAGAGLAIADQFRSDGREGNLSLYTVLQPAATLPGRPDPV